MISRHLPDPMLARRAFDTRPALPRNRLQATSASCAGPAVQSARAAWSLALLGWPSTILDLIGAPSDRLTCVVVRLLGLRHLLEAGLLLVRPSPRSYRLGAFVDILHSLTMSAAFVIDPPRRRAALASAVGASAWATATLLTLPNRNLAGIRG